MVIQKRAVRQEQKEARRQEIVDIALQLFETSTYKDISMAQIAKQGGMAKGTVFLYFKTKEELFLTVTWQAFDRWFDSLDRLLLSMRRSGKRMDQKQALAALQQTFMEHKPLVRLITILHVILEHNIPYQTALDFKLNLALRTEKTGDMLEQTFAFLKPGQGQKILIWLKAMVIGFAQMAEPAPVIAEIMKREPSLKAYAIDFSKHYFEALTAIFVGWQTMNAAPAGRRHLKKRKKR